MFTGLVEDVGKVLRADRRGDALELEIAPSAIAAEQLQLGESVAVNGACLTVTAIERGSQRFRVLAGPETITRTTAASLRPGAAVNLERALLATSRLGGHIVAGHVDGIGEIVSRRDKGRAVEIQVRAPREVLRYVVEKGSIAMDGVSLTVNRVDDYSFAVMLIPHTLENTTIAAKQIGDKVNLEADVVGKYVEKFAKEHFSR
ncbi:MAG: riboflavin synthase [Pseudomonadota bacterium]